MRKVNEKARENGAAGARKRWGCRYCKTATIRAFRDMVNVLQAEVPIAERAQFVTDALKEALQKRLEAKGRSFDLFYGACQL